MQRSYPKDSTAEWKTISTLEWTFSGYGSKNCIHPSETQEIYKKQPSNPGAVESFIVHLNMMILLQRSDKTPAYTGESYA